MRNVYKILGAKPECKRPLATPRLRRQTNIKMNLAKIGWQFGVFDEVNNTYYKEHVKEKHNIV
jgi:hypothetical protein